MGRPKNKFTPPCRILTSAPQVAAILGRSEQWFRDNMTTLETHGFPKKDGLLGGWDMEAIHAWLDNRAQLGKNHHPLTDDDFWDAAFNEQD